MEVLSFKSIFQVSFLFLLLFCSSALVYSQEEAAAEAAPDGEGALPPISTKLSPVFPEVEEGPHYVEGESAVSTNFCLHSGL